MEEFRANRGAVQIIQENINYFKRELLVFLFHFNLKMNEQAICVFKLNEFFTRKNFYTTDNFIDFIINFP